MILLMAAVNLGTLAMGRSIARAREMAVRTALGASRASPDPPADRRAHRPRRRRRDRRVAPRLRWRCRSSPGRFHRRCRGRVRSRLTSPCSAWSSPRRLACRPCSRSFRHQSRHGPSSSRSSASSQGGETPARRRAMGALVAAQIALAVVLGIGASLLLRSLWNLQRRRSRLRRGARADVPIADDVEVHRAAGGSALLRTGRRARARAARRDARRLDSASADDRLQLDERGPSGRAAAGSLARRQRARSGASSRGTTSRRWGSA